MQIHQNRSIGNQTDSRVCKHIFLFVIKEGQKNSSSIFLRKRKLKKEFFVFDYLSFFEKKTQVCDYYFELKGYLFKKYREIYLNPRL
jgi:hypothetical protein